MDLGSVEKVCEILADRGVSDHVICNFRRNKMDKASVWSASEDDLKSLGLVEKGHIISIKGLCNSENITENQDLLSSSIVSSGKDRCKGKKRRITQKSVHVGWMHFDSKSNKYKSVRYPKGGGSRIEIFDDNDDTEKVIRKCKELFFPDGKSFHGMSHEMDFQLGNFKGEIETNFCVIDYIKKNKLSKTRLYLLTKKKNLFKELLKRSDFSLASSSDDDFEETTENSTKKQKHVDILDKTSLMGTSAERKELMDRIDQAFQESLAADQKKEKDKVDSRDREEQLQTLMQQRKARLEPEPNLDDPHATVLVRHPSLGPKGRIFRPETTMSAVYDWVGSLSLLPKYFAIKDYAGVVISPETKIESGAYNVFEVEKPILMSPSGTVSFSGFATKESLKSDNIQHHFEQLEKLRNAESLKLTNDIYATVKRETTYEDIIRLYRKRGTVTSKVNLLFENEDAYGDGVSRDAYSEFFENFYKKLDGGAEKVPSPNEEEEELEIVGKIITHAYITYNVFPLQLCKSTLKYYIYDAVSDEELFQSYMRYLPQKESDLILDFEKNSNIDSQAISDILSDVAIFTQPTQHNIKELMIKAAKTTLVKNPCFAIQSMVKGLGSFWKHLTLEDFDSLYQRTIPTPDVVISSLHVEENSKQEGKTVTWLHRYIRCCSQEELIRFVRFITGSSVFVPKTVIKVEFVDQPVSHLRPLTQTCFKILILARQYTSFSQFVDNLNMYISNMENWVVHDTLS